MFKLNLKIALRNLWRNKTSSFINVIGLAIGLAACLMLLVYVSYEWSFDKQSKDASLVHTFMTHIREDNGKVMFTFDGTTTALGPLVRQGVPEVKYLSRTSYSSKALIANKETSFKKTGKFAEPDLLKIFNYQFVAGDPKTAMTQPRSILLTESTAELLFGSTDVINRAVRYQDRYDLKVTGVIRDLPDNSSNKFDYLMPWAFLEAIDENAKNLNWGNFSYVTMVALQPSADLDKVNKKIDALIKRNFNSNKAQPFFLYPLNKMHLYGKFENGVSVGGNIEQIWLFTGLGFGILLIACVNFMNMATARSERRAKEVGIKKTIGATRISLISQFLLESLVLTLIAVIMAIALVEAFLPSFNNLLGIEMTIGYFNIYSWIGILGIVFATGLVAGSYPAFYLSSFNPVQTLKRNLRTQSMWSVSLRQVLIVGQFCFTVMLIISTIMIYKQIQYIKNKPLGADINILAEIPQDGMLYEKFNLLRTSLLQSGAVTSLCKTSVSLLHHGSNFNGLEWPGIRQDQRSILFNQVGTGYGFVKTNGLKIVAGRDFSEQYASDSAAVMVSTSAVKMIGLKNPVGTVLRFSGRQAPIIGVFEDYVWDSPYKSNAPMVVYFSKGGGNITLRLNPANSLQESTAKIKEIVKQINPAYPAEISFLSEAYNKLFESERKLGILSNLFGGLAIFISCLGLYGLVAFSAEQRTKEFGVRKVLGASISNLMQLLSVSFAKMILIAILIAVPAACYLMNRWLMKFEYHTNISWWVILLASAGTLLIAMFTLSFQAYKSAIANPVDALKYE